MSEPAKSVGRGLVLSPVVRRLIAESGIDPATITGTGRGGRITRSDVEQAIRARASVPAGDAAAAPEDAVPQPAPSEPPPAERPPSEPPPAEPPSEPPPAEPSPDPAPSGPAPSRQAPAVPAVVARSGDSVVPLNRIRRRTADHMVMSKQTSPHVLTAIEVDYEGVEKVRQASKQAWKAAEGFSLTYLPFIARAVVDALRDYPHLNASFGDDELIVHSNVNLAIAVDIDFQGLLAPVIQAADGKRLRQIARDIVDLANRARSRKLSPDDLSGGTFTLTNAGQYGTMMQFPIINQPQVAILSTDGVTRKPVVVTDSFGNESIAIHSIGVLAMAWDHRAFDGAYAAAFLHRVKELIETRDWETEIR
ncbi:MAG: dihydrolipoamide acetyltransferase family protein [Acidimicrobiaceae bacterium]|nr:dihydrolipoamide acetyltransferase family protein [Acidimicrobiaceae bacterium]